MVWRQEDKTTLASIVLGENKQPFHWLPACRILCSCACLPCCLIVKVKFLERFLQTWCGIYFSKLETTMLSKRSQFQKIARFLWGVAANMEQIPEVRQWNELFTGGMLVISTCVYVPVEILWSLLCLLSTIISGKLSLWIQSGLKLYLYTYSWR